MSIINRVLQEIEKNKTRVEPEAKLLKPGFGASAAESPRKIFRGNAVFIITLIILILLIAIFYFVPHKLHACKKGNVSSGIIASTIPKKTLNSSDKEPAKTNTQQTQGTAQPGKAAAVKLEDITLNADKGKTIVNFKLSGETYYYLEHSQDQQQLKLILGNTSFIRAMSPDVTHTAIKKLFLVASGDSVEVNLDLFQDTQIISLQFVNEASSTQPILQLTLLNTSIPQGTVNKETVPLTAEQRAMQDYENALNLVAQDKEDIAIGKLVSIVRVYKSDVSIYELLATLLIKHDRLEQALRVLNEATALYPSNHHLIQLKAYILSQKGYSDRALKLLLQNPPEITDDPNYYVYMANIYQQQGKFMLAARLYDRLVKIQPGNAMWWVGLGIAMESASQSNAAREAYYRASELGGNLPPAVQSFLQNKIGAR